MRFLIQRDAQNRTLKGMPIAVEVTEHPRDEHYPLPCKCPVTYEVSRPDIAKLVERGMVLASQVEDLAGTLPCVCGCLGRVEMALNEETEKALRILVNKHGSNERGLFEADVRELLMVAMRQALPKPGALKLERPLCSWDLEGTGLDTETSQIVEASFVVLYPDGKRTVWTQRFRPTIPIPAEATAVHGITDADVADKPSFASLAPKIHKALQGKDFVTFNGRSYDWPLLDSEMRRAGLKLDLTGVRMIDAFGIFQNKEPHNLEAFVEKFTGRKHEGAHGAEADAVGTLDGLLGCLTAYPDLVTLDDLAEASLRDPEKRPADLAGKLYYSADGLLRYSFAKVKDVAVRDDIGFAMWMRRQGNFPGSTMEVLNAELARLGQI